MSPVTKDLRTSIQKPVFVNDLLKHVARILSQGYNQIHTMMIESTKQPIGDLRPAYVQFCVELKFEAPKGTYTKEPDSMSLKFPVRPGHWLRIEAIGRLDGKQYGACAIVFPWRARDAPSIHKRISYNYQMFKIPGYRYIGPRTLQTGLNKMLDLAKQYDTKLEIIIQPKFHMGYVYDESKEDFRRAKAPKFDTDAFETLFSSTYKTDLAAAGAFKVTLTHEVAYVSDDGDVTLAHLGI